MVAWNKHTRSLFKLDRLPNLHVCMCETQEQQKDERKTGHCLIFSMKSYVNRFNRGNQLSLDFYKTMKIRDGSNMGE